MSLRFLWVPVGTKLNLFFFLFICFKSISWWDQPKNPEGKKEKVSFPSECTGTRQLLVFLLLNGSSNAQVKDTERIIIQKFLDFLEYLTYIIFFALSGSVPSGSSGAFAFGRWRPRGESPEARKCEWVQRLKYAHLVCGEFPLALLKPSDPRARYPVRSPTSQDCYLF